MPEERVDEQLKGRLAICTYQARHLDQKPVPSSRNLAFFEYLGPDSEEAAIRCGNCGYHEVAHHRQEKLVDPRSVIERGKCSGFVPHGPWEYDRYYCGCYGWD